MGWIRSALALGLGLVLFAPAANAVPELNDNPTPFVVRVPYGTTTRVPLRSAFLKSPMSGTDLTWGTFTPMPAWSKFDITNQNDQVAVVTTPPLTAVGVPTTFTIFVREVADPDGNFDSNPVAWFVYTTAPWKVAELDLGTIAEGGDFTFDVKQASLIENDPAGKPLTFKIEGNLPAWLTFANGVFTGNPKRADVGSLGGFTVVATTESGGVTKVPVKGKVVKACKAPAWTANPLLLPNGKEDIHYSQNLQNASFITHTEPEPLSFKITAGVNHTWLRVDATTGVLEGDPVRANVGAVSVQAEVSSTCEGVTRTATTTLKFDVRIVNKPPTWTTNPIVLPDGFTRTAYPAQNLAVFAKDGEPGFNPTFRLDPADQGRWARVSQTGSFSGTPQNADLGANEFTVLVSDGEFEVPVKVQLAVKNRAPKWVSDPVLLKPDATEDAPYSVKLSGFASDPENDPLTFTLKSQSNWASVNAVGELVGTPLREHVGLQTFRIEVKDQLSGGSHEVDVQLNVRKINKKPVWSQEEITLPDAFERSDYAQSLKQFVSDPDTEDTLTFTKLSDTNSKWSLVGVTDGAVTGKPQRKDVGDGSFIVRVQDQGGLSAVALVHVKVVKVNQVPLCTQPASLKDAVAKFPYDFDIKSLASDPDQDALTFSAVSVPTWMTVAANGKLSGTPDEAAIGPYQAEFEVKDPDGATCQLVAQGKVQSGNKPPVWSATPLVLPDAVVGMSYIQYLTKFVTDPENDVPLKFEPLDSSPWVYILEKGTVIGTPEVSNLGLHKIRVKVTDFRGASSENEVHINVVQKATQRPEWTKNPIDLGVVQVGAAINFDLKPFVVDPDSTILQFRKPTGQPPAWIGAQGDGRVLGSPQLADVGPYTTVFEVSDDGVFWVRVDAFGKVTTGDPGKPPAINQNALVFTVRAGEVFEVNLNQPLYVTDPDQPLRFEATPPALPWLTLGQDGKLTLRPQLPQVGQHTQTMRVTDATSAFADATIRINVITGGNQPTWKQDPIRFDAFVNLPFSASLVDKVNNPSGLPLTFTKMSGKTWLGYNTLGAISGLPTDPDLGENFFTFEVRNSAGAAVATVIINVKPVGPSEDSIRIDEPVSGARVDNTWIVDNRMDPCSGESCFISELRQSIGIYYNELDRAGIAHYGVYLAADACNYRAPIRDSQGRYLLKYTDRDWVQSFNSRISRSAGGIDFSSPVVAFWQFLNSSVSSAPAPYFESQVPMETLILSSTDDKYRNFYHWAPISGWVPSNFLAYYVNTHRNAAKPLRISALAAQSNAYNTVVTGTGGKYYRYGQVDFASSIRDYAEQVIFRAYVTAKKRIKLTRVPSNPASIKVTLAGAPLAADKWRYLAASNEIEVFWNLIDLSGLKPGDRLVIEY